MADGCVLGVAEKPSVARRISQILSGGKVAKFEGVSKYNPVYSFKLNGDEYRITSVLGHILESDFPDEFNSWRAVDPLFLITDAPVIKKIIKENLKVVKNIQKEAKNARELIIMTDYDREGENIGFEVFNMVLNANKSIKNVKRMKFSAVTRPEVMSGFKVLIDPDRNLSDAAEARQEIDLRLGAAFTRKATLSIDSKIRGKDIISIGPVQTPTLGLVADRWESIQEFVPRDFWFLKAFLKINGEVFEADWAEGRAFEKEKAVEAYNRIKDEKEAFVKSVTEKKNMMRPPKPMNTITLTQLATQILNISSEKCMYSAEALYNAGIISYPRTETEKYPASLDLNKILSDHKPHSVWGNYIEQNLLKKPLKPTSGKRDDKAHPPIHPTTAVEKSVLQNMPELKKISAVAWAVYELVTRHFLATLSDSAELKRGNVQFTIKGEGFKITGLRIIKEGFLEIYPYQKVSEIFLPKKELKVGDMVFVDEIQLKAGKTTPPKLLRESELIRLMDKLGLGTDATIPQHIQTNIKRSYFRILKGKSRFIEPTGRGVALIRSLKKSVAMLVDPEIRAYIERQISKISEGDLTYEQVVSEAREKIGEIFLTFSKNISAYAEEMNKSIAEEKGKEVKLKKVGQCPICGENLIAKKVGEKRFVGCSGYPSCNWIFPLPREKKIKIGKNLCPKCGSKLLYWYRDDRVFEICAGCKTWCWKCDERETCPALKKEKTKT